MRMAGAPGELGPLGRSLYGLAGVSAVPEPGAYEKRSALAPRVYAH